MCTFIEWFIAAHTTNICCFELIIADFDPQCDHHIKRETSTQMRNRGKQETFLHVPFSGYVVDDNIIPAKINRI